MPSMLKKYRNGFSIFSKIVRCHTKWKVDTANFSFQYLVTLTHSKNSSSWIAFICSFKVVPIIKLFLFCSNKHRKYQNFTWPLSTNSCYSVHSFLTKEIFIASTRTGLLTQKAFFWGRGCWLKIKSGARQTILSIFLPVNLQKIAAVCWSHCVISSNECVISQLTQLRGLKQSINSVRWRDSLDVPCTGTKCNCDFFKKKPLNLS